MKQGLSLRVSQHLALTPQLQQSIRLLQLSTLELSQEVEQMLDENPFLERSEDQATREEFGLAQVDTPVSEGDRVLEYSSSNALDDGPSSSSSSSSSDEEVTPLTADSGPDWDGDGTTEMAPDDSEWGGDAKARNGQFDSDGEQDASELARAQESLQSFLHRQALSLRLQPAESAALRFLIESLNDDGYLEDKLETLADSLHPEDDEAQQMLVHHFAVALGLLHNLEPVGVGARDLGECLRLQLRSALYALSPQSSPRREMLEVALRICAEPMELLARRDIKRLVQKGVGSDALVREAITCIGRLEPKPGRRFVDVERNIVVPDVLVLAAGTTRNGQPKFRVMLNPEVMPRLKVHDIYANALRGQRGAKDAAGHAAMQQRLQEARWFIKNVQQRFDTILRVSTAIVERQKSFFQHGELAMRPLVLREIADELGLHESTISRVTSAKYMATPFGTFELKYFFGSGLGTESGSNASSTAVRGLIKQFISAESDKKPLSDNQISEMLKEQGIECARRTVAKYREGLKIAPASLRKAL